jgi:hypothetical protein
VTPASSSPRNPLTLLTFDRSSAPKLFAIVDRLEQELGLPHGFYEKLVDVDDDWSFVLKVHALMEASLAILLAERIGGRDLPNLSNLSNSLSRLEMNRRHTGKVDLAFTLGLIKERDRLLLRQLSELRNTYVHQVRNVGLSLVDHVATFDQNQRTNFAHALFNNPTEQTTAVSLAHPRRALWLTSLMLLHHLRVQFEALQVVRGAPGTNKAAYMRQMEELSEDLDQLLQQARGDIAEQTDP